MMYRKAVIPKKVANKYLLGDVVGSGTFGVIYKGTNTETSEEVAIKLEEILWDQEGQLANENKVYNEIAGGDGIPQLKWYGREGDYRVLVMDFLGPSLEEYFNYCNRKFTLKTVLLLADQMITRIEYLHSRHYLHRDLKPANFLMGLGDKSNLVYLIDYGLASEFRVKYRDAESREHIRLRVGLPLTGTARYASLNTHRGREQSRRDDLESLAYIFIYFITGTLPWQSMTGRTKRQKYERIHEKKIATTLQELAKLVGEVVFIEYLSYCRDMSFDVDPNYEYIRAMFRRVFDNHRFVNDNIFDWSTLKYDEMNTANWTSLIEKKFGQLQLSTLDKAKG